MKHAAVCAVTVTMIAASPTAAEPLAKNIAAMTRVVDALKSAGIDLQA